MKALCRALDSHQQKGRPSAGLSPPSAKGGHITPGRVASFLLEHSFKIGAAIAIVAGLVWLLSPPDDPLKVLEARCKEQKLPIRVVELEPGSLQEEKFMLMVPASNRERVSDKNWAFCRANLIMVPREGPHR